jgi:hypothetical protein
MTNPFVKFEPCMNSTLTARMLALLMLTIACSDSITTPRDDNDKLKQILVAMGFSQEDIVDDGARFVVQRDMLFYKDKLRELSGHASVGPQAAQNKINAPSRPTTQWIVSGYAWHSQSYGLHPVSPFYVDLSAIADRPAYLQAVRSAMLQWNNIPEANTNFVEGTGNETIHVEAGTCPSGFACAALPVNMRIGSPLTITSGFDSWNPGQQLFMMVHELGHAMGMLHTDWNYWGEPATGNPYKVIGTPDFDSESVMNSHTAGWYFSGFTLADRRAAAYINTRGFSGTYSDSGPMASWPTQTEAQYYHVEEYYRWYTQDEYGTLQEQSGYVVVGDVTGASVDLPPADRGDGSCAYQVIVRAVYASGAQTYAYIPVATSCVEAGL